MAGVAGFGQHGCVAANATRMLALCRGRGNAQGVRQFQAPTHRLALKIGCAQAVRAIEQAKAPQHALQRARGELGEAQASNTAHTSRMLITRRLLNTRMLCFFLFLELTIAHAEPAVYGGLLEKRRAKGRRVCRIVLAFITVQPLYDFVGHFNGAAWHECFRGIVGSYNADGALRDVLAGYEGTGTNAASSQTSPTMHPLCSR